MDAVRCTQCGDVRWSFRGLPGRRETRCELCGAVMIPERRHPDRGPDTLGAERRKATPLAPPNPPRPAAR
jgi:hypothetical protein